MTRTHRFRLRLFLALWSLLMTGGWGALADDEWYTAQAGDSIGSIAAYFGIAEGALIERNNLSAGERLSRGQILRIPVADGFTVTHSVQAGETLREIADRYGMDWRALAAVNGIANPNRIHVIQVLVVPGAAQIAALPTPTPTATPFPIQRGAAQRIYIAQAGDTLAGIARRYAVPLDALREFNHIRGEFLLYGGDLLLIPPGNIADAQRVATPAAGERRHVVRFGETLGAIAALYGRDMWDIAAANGILDPHLIYVSQVLIIP